MAHPFRLITGLGNPGREYAATRHNAGAWFVERLARLLRVEFRAESKFQAMVASTRTSDGADLKLALPQTFMNRSGTTVAALARFYRITPAEILVAHDELDLKPGTVKLKQGGGNAGHNGLKDISAQIGSDFWRMRIGVGHPRDGALSEQEVADYVLHPPRGDDPALIADAITRALAIWPRLAAGETERAMHELHTVPRAEAPMPAPQSRGNGT